MAENAHTEASGGEHGNDFPPFQPENFPSQVLWLVVTFVALYLLMSRVALPRIGAIFESRKARIDDDLTEAERLKAESDQAIAAYEKALADARTRAQALANETREKEAAAAEERRKALDARLNARIAEAEKAIAATCTAAMANVNGIAIEAAAAIIERLTGAAPSPSQVAGAVAEVLKR